MKIFYDSTSGGKFNWNFPYKIFSDHKNKIYVVDFGNDRVLIYDSIMNYVNQLGRSGSGDGEFNKPSSIFIDRNENVYVLDLGNERIQMFSKELKLLTKIKIPKKTMHFTVDHDGSIYLSIPAKEGLFMKIDREGKFKKYFGNLIDLEKKNNARNISKLYYDYDAKQICAVFNFFPIVQYYSTKGKLIKTVKLHNKNLTEINNLVNINEIPTLSHFYTNTHDMCIRNDKCYILIPHGKNIPACVYIISKKGKKIGEIFLRDENNLPLKKPVSITVNDHNKLFVSTADNRVVIFQLNLKKYPF
jgi:hypothetical protein